MKRKIKLSALLLLFSVFVRAQIFIHPGILHAKEDLDRMKKAVNSKDEPIYSGYKIFTEDPVSKHTYKMQGPMEMVGRNPTVGQVVYDTDANAAHQNAIMWAITGEKAYANKAIEIINAWSTTLKSITGRDAVLMAGLGPFKMVNAAEIIRYTNAGWSDADIKLTEDHFKEVIYPVIKNYAPFANGNWDAAALKTVFAIAVFCNNQTMFEDALKYYVNGHGNGRLTHYVINAEGQVQESGRDQGHTQLGIGMLAECSEIAWHQGLNLYGYADNRLLKGFEYVARFNLGNEVPFVETLDRTGKYHHKTIARQDRGPLRAVYEQVYNHYVNRIGLPANFTQQAAEKLRPEGPGRPGADHPGYGTLYFSRNTNDNYNGSAIPVAPAGIIAGGNEKEIVLSWIAPRGAQSFSISRSEKQNGIFTIISRNNKTASYTDKSIKAGKQYYYKIRALGAGGESENSVAISAYAGLPASWKQLDIGEVGGQGASSFNGSEFLVNAFGKGLDSLADAVHYTYIPMIGNAEITLRYVPQLSSQFSSFGVSIRKDLSANDPYVSLSLNPGKSGQIEAPNWQANLAERTTKGGVSKLITEMPVLSESAVTNGRLTGYFWLRLRRENGSIYTSTSINGKEWTAVGSTRFNNSDNAFIGFFAASGMPNDTIIKFDHVAVRSIK